MQRTTLTLLLILLLGLTLRTINIRHPLLDGATTRQIQGAEAARNYYRNGNAFSLPQLDRFGPGKGYMALEFPIVPYTVGLIYRLLGGAHTWVYRLLTAICSTFSALVLFLLIRRTDDSTTGLFGALAYVMSPQEIYLGRSTQPESVMMLFSMLAPCSFYGGVREAACATSLLASLPSISPCS